MTTEDITSLMEFGVLGTIVLVCLFAIIKGITKGTVWLGIEIIVPVKEKFIEHLQKTGEILEAIRKTNEDEQGERHQMLRTLSEHTTAINRIDKNIEEMKREAKGFFREQHIEHEQRNS